MGEERRSIPFLIESIKGLIQQNIFVNLNFIHARSFRLHDGGRAYTTRIIIAIKQIHPSVLTLSFCKSDA